MKTMERMGKAIASRPWVSIGIVLLITIAAFASISSNGITFDLDEDEMSPQTDAYDADRLMRDVFRFEMSSINLLRADDALSKDSFLAAIEYERQIFEHPLTNGYLIRPDDATKSFQNPYSILMAAMVPMLDAPALDGNETFHEGLIAYAQHNSEAALKENASILLQMEAFDGIRGLITKDLDVENATASGAMIITVIDRNKILGNGEMDMLAYEAAVKDIAANVTAAHPDVRVQIFDEYTIIMNMANVADSDLGFLFPLALLLMVAILMLMYRDFVDMLVAITCLIFAIMWTFGAAVAFNIGVSTISIAVPILVLGLGIDYALHLVYRYRDERGEGISNEESSANAVGSVGEALLLATITTVIAFLSNVSSSMKMISDFGLLSAVGILCSFTIMILVIPAVQSIRDRRAAAKDKSASDIRRYRRRTVKDNDTIGRISMIGGHLALRKPMAVMVAGVIVLGGFGFAAANVSYQFDVFDFLPEDTDAYDMLTFIFDEFMQSGQSTAEILIYGDPTDPVIIRGIERSVDNMLDTRHVYIVGGEARTLHIGTELFKLYNELDDATFNATYEAAFNATDGRILEDTNQTQVQAVISMLMAMNDDNVNLTLSRVIGSAPGGEPLTRIQVFLDDMLTDPEALQLRDDLFIAITPLTEEGIRAVPTGMLISNAVIMDEMQRDQMTSLLITLAFTLLVLTVAMFYLNRSLILGVLATLPTVLSVIMVWGSMYLMDISLNVMTLTIASLTVGIGVTYGIHIVHRFAGEMRKGLSPEDAVMVTTGATGRGVLGAALTTAVGFGILGFSSMVPLAQFGMISAMAIAYAYMGATIALPTLLVIWGRRNASKA